MVLLKTSEHTNKVLSLQAQIVLWQHHSPLAASDLITPATLIKKQRDARAIKRRFYELAQMLQIIRVGALTPCGQSVGRIILIMESAHAALH